MRLAAALVLLLAAPAMASTIHVPGDQPTIQAGVDAAAAGDTVLVAPGTYHDCTHADSTGTLNCLLLDKGLSLLAEGSPANTTIDAQQRGRPISCRNTNSPTTIDGFTITGGAVVGSFTTGRSGGGVLVQNAVDVTISNCRVRDNLALEGSQRFATFTGGGIRIDGSTVRIVSSEISDNRALDSTGGGISVTWGSAEISDCDIRRNVAINGGGVHAFEASLSIDDCQISENKAVSGGGIWYGFESSGPHASSLAEITNTEISGNVARGRGGGLCASYPHGLTLSHVRIVGNRCGSYGGGVITESGGAILDRCTVSGNHAGENGGGLYAGYIEHKFGDIYALESVVWGNCAAIDGDEVATFISGVVFECAVVDSGGIAVNANVGYIGDNLFTDPLFCDPKACDDAPTTEGDYTVASNSPCLPQNNSCGVQIGAFGEGCGPVSVDAESWAGIKSRYREGAK